MRLPVVSGKEVIKYLSRICFKHIRTRGSHAFLKRLNLRIVIPLHSELSKGVTKSIILILEKIGYSRKEAIDFIRSGMLLTTLLRF